MSRSFQHHSWVSDPRARWDRALLQVLHPPPSASHGIGTASPLHFHQSLYSKCKTRDACNTDNSHYEYNGLLCDHNRFHHRASSAGTCADLRSAEKNIIHFVSCAFVTILKYNFSEENILSCYLLPCYLFVIEIGDPDAFFHPMLHQSNYIFNLLYISYIYSQNNTLTNDFNKKKFINSLKSCTKLRTKCYINAIFIHLDQSLQKLNKVDF